MADAEDNIFVYMGGEQEVPDDVRRVVIDRSVKIIPAWAFARRRRLVSVNMHDEVEKIERDAFYQCVSLKKIDFIGVREVGRAAFYNCKDLADVEFGDELETIEARAFFNCQSLQKIEMPSVRTVEEGAFVNCTALTDLYFGSNLETIRHVAFLSCPLLRRIVIPLKDDIFPLDPRPGLDPTQRPYTHTQFNHCRNLTTVDLVGGIHKTISSLLLESWQTEINQEIDRINQDLPSSDYRKTDAIRTWIRTVIDIMEYYKAEHNILLKEDMTQLELAIWKAKLDEKEDDDSTQKVQTKKAKIDVESVRKERRIKSGADIIIRNVLPFLQLSEEE